MNTRYDIAQIRRIISDFANITGLSIAFLDTDFNFIAIYNYNASDFCQKIQNCGSGMQLCYHSDLEMLKECRRTRGFVSHTCHAGIIDSVMPVFKDMAISGYIMLGRIRPSENVEDIYPKIAWIKDLENGPNQDGAEPTEDLAALQESYMKIAYFDRGQLESISRLVSDSLFANAIEVTFEAPLKTVLVHISENLNGDLSVANLCKISHLSKNALYKCFQDTFDCTVNEYITHQRIQAAKLLLETTEKTVQEIGEAVGAEHPAHFCRLFKKETGLAPSAYRREARQSG